MTAREQAAAAIESHLGTHLPDSGGVLRGVVLRHVADGDRLLAELDHPLAALAGYAREVWGRTTSWVSWSGRRTRSGAG